MATQCYAAVALKSLVCTDAVTAVPMVLKDGYGRKLDKEGLKIEESDLVDQECKKELCTDKEWIKQGLMVPNAALERGTQFFKMHIRNVGSRERLLREG